MTIYIRSLAVAAVLCAFIGTPETVLAQQEACMMGFTEITAILPNGNTHLLCLPNKAVRALENSPGQGGKVLDIAECPCDFSFGFVEKLDWNLGDAKCEDWAEEPRDIVFALRDSLAGGNSLWVSGGTFAKGNRCTADVTIGGEWFPNFQEHGDMTNTEVTACIRDLSAAADRLGVPNECN